MLLNLSILFLSCLCGSELKGIGAAARAYFLSCLCGSEPGVWAAIGLDKFLSCLCGSELEQISLNPLQNKRLERLLWKNLFFTSPVSIM